RGAERARARVFCARSGVSPPLGRTADMTRIVAEALRERGYLNATITPRSMLEHAPERATLVFTIHAGRRAAIGQIDVVGVPAAARAEVLGRLGLAPGAAYQRD